MGDNEHVAEPAPPTTRIYVPAPDGGDLMIDGATTDPPAGSMDGWFAFDVDQELWREYAAAAAASERAMRAAGQAREVHRRAEERLEEAIDRG